MKIQTTGLNTKLTFKSIRTDKNTVAQLKTGKKPIIENNKNNIYAALNNLSTQTDRESIEFLLDVADNLAYGQGATKKVLDKDGITPEERENTPWSVLLQDTINKALSSSSDDVEDLKAEYKRIFGEEKELSSEQKSILDLRNDLTTAVLSISTLEDEESVAMTARVRKNLDYFVASSEISTAQKQECLEKLNYLVSDDYKINPQLKDKKLQVLDEVLNDMIIKTPEDEVLTIKSVNQRQTGMCAAISICRKDMAYEDKTRFVELILDELSADPNMHVYDITDLESGNKVEIPKTYVDYKAGMSHGYRIIDTAAHLWMHNAHSSGDGSLQTEHYIPFDDENYGVYNDSSWYLGLDDKYSGEKALLMALIKENEFIKSFSKTKKDMEDVHINISSVKKEAYESQKAANGKLNSTLSYIFPEKSQSQISKLISSLQKFYTGSSEDNKINVPSKLPVEVKREIIANYLIDSNSDITEAQKSKIKEKSNVIYDMLDENKTAESKLSRLKRFNSPKAKYLVNKKLYNIAAAHRLAIEADVNLPDGVMRFEKLSGLPTRDVQISNYMKSLNNKFSSKTVRQQFADEKGNIPSQEELEKSLVSDLVKMETVIPADLSSITKTLFNKTTSQLASEMFKGIAEAIKDNNSDTIANMKAMLSVKGGDKDEILQKVNKWADKLENSPSKETLLEGIRILGYEDAVQFTSVFVSSFMQALQQGISEEQYANLVDMFGGEENVVKGISAQRDKFVAIQQEYQSIMNKWNVPSTRTLILEQLEKQNSVLSRRKLDILKNRFATIEAGTIKNESIPNSKKRQEANSLLYKFTNDEMDIFSSIEKNMQAMKKYSKMQYQYINKYMNDALEEQYSNIGMLNGQFWVREEGSSGLSANEQIRIIEQMTGKPYHMETDALEAAKQIKKGEGSGILSMSVDDSDYAFHAQYVPAVTSEKFTDPVTKKSIVQDIMWTDNSWGRSEKDSYWDGKDGHNYTDYNGGYGWKKGFVLADDFKIGLPVKDLFGAIGYAKEDKEKFGLFTDVVLPGMPVNAYQKLYKMFAHIFDVKNGDTYYNALENALSNGYKINVKELESLDDLAEIATNRIVKRVEKEIKSEEDFNKLANDDELKIAFEKLAVYMSTDNQMAADSVLMATSLDEIKEIKQGILEEHIYNMESLLGRQSYILESLPAYTAAEFSKLLGNLNSKFNLNISENEFNTIKTAIFAEPNENQNVSGSLKATEDYLMNQVVNVALAKFEEEDEARFFIENAQAIIADTIENKVKIKSLDSAVLSNSPLGEKLLAAIDKYLNPSSDKELLSMIQSLQMADDEVVEDFFSALTPEDVGIKERKAYDYIKLYKSGDSSVSKSLSEMVGTVEIYSNLKTSENEEEGNTPEELYRNLYVKLSDLNVQKYIKAFKAEAFLKYKVRQAFPQPVIIPDETIEKTAFQMLEGIKETFYNIESNKYVLDVLTKYGEIKDGYFSEPIIESLKNNKEVQMTSDNKQFIKEFTNKLYELYQLSSADSSFAVISRPLESLIKELRLPNETIDGRKISNSLKELIGVFDDFEATGINKDRFIQLNNDELKVLNENIKLMINSNVEQKYRDDAYNKMHKIIDLYKKNADESSIEIAVGDFVNTFVDKHIIKSPLDLLRQAVDLIQNDKKETDEYAIISSYLKEALHIASQTKIQYKLVQNQHEAIGSKTKEMLPLFNVSMADGSKEEMNSELGMLYLVEQLKNRNDNNTILNLFLEQSGLSKKALSALLNTFEIEKTKDLIDEKADNVIGNVEKLDELASIVGRFMQMSQIKYKSLEDAMGHFNTYIKRTLKGYENDPVFASFVNYIDSLQFNKSIETYNPSMIKPLLGEITKDALSYIAENINGEMEYISSISELLNDRVDLISSIRVPFDSKEYAARNDFYEDFGNVCEYIGEVQKEIYDAVSNCNFINAQQ